MKALGAATFKTHCLALLDEIAATGEEVWITKRGKPLLRVIPCNQPALLPQTALVGTVQIHGDILSPVLDASTWDAERRQL